MLPEGKPAHKTRRGRTLFYNKRKREEETVLDAALREAADGNAVFPVVPRGKKPMTRHGHLDATTDPDRIRDWFGRWRDANLGLATGRASGLAVLDVDPQHGGLETMFTLRPVPPTLTVATGGGKKGCQLFFEVPEGIVVPTTAGRIGPGLDTRGEGGYVVASPSVTVLRYTVLRELPPTPVPGWLLERLLEAPGSEGGVPEGPVSVEGPPVLEGTRNRTLFRIGCKLRGQGYAHPAILSSLEWVNATRCVPPLDSSEVAGIAWSCMRYEPGTNGPEVPVEVLMLLSEIDASRFDSPLPDAAHKLYGALVRAASRHGQPASVVRHGELVPAVRVDHSHRQLCEASGLSRPTVAKRLVDLKRLGLVRSDDLDRLPNQPSAFLLPSPTYAHDARASLPTTPVVAHTPEPEGHATTGSVGKAPRAMRRSAGGVRRLGWRSERVVEVLLREGGEAGVGEIGGRIGMKRPRDLGRKGGPLERLREAGIISVDCGTVKLTSGWEEALERAAERGLEAEAAEVQRTGHALERAITLHPPDTEAVDTARSAHEAARRALRDGKERAAERLAGEQRVGSVAEVFALAAARSTVPEPDREPPVPPPPRGRDGLAHRATSKAEFFRKELRA